MSDEEPTDEREEPLGDLRDEISSRTEDDDSRDESASPEDSKSERSPDESENADGPLGDLRRQIGNRTNQRRAESADTERSKPTDTEVTDPGDGEPDPADTTAAQPDADDDDRFAEMGVEDVDSEDLWADLLLDDGPTEGSFPPTETTHRADGTYHEVTKRLCHRCEYFGDPPILHCTHEGTTIHELVDMDHYLVSDCPMVDTNGEITDRS